VPQERQGHPPEDDSDARWRVSTGPGLNYIRFEDLILVSLHHVSIGSWQPQLRLNRSFDTFPSEASNQAKSDFSVHNRRESSEMITADPMSNSPAGNFLPTVYSTISAYNSIASRWQCSYCGKKFSRPSGLKVCLLTYEDCNSWNSESPFRRFT